MYDTHDLAALAQSAKAAREASDDLIGYLAEVVEAQWEPSPIPKPREDTFQRSSGEIPDPTLSIVSDPRRLALRDAVKEATRALEQATETARVARRRLERAADSWAGHDPR